MRYKVNILNPKATKILQSLADRKWISIKKIPTGKLLQAISRIRKAAASKNISLEEITKEVEVVRSNRYRNRKKS